MITVENLTKRYGDFQALKSISFSVEEGGCVGFLGPNGAGKTTTIRILTGLAKPTSGRATVDGLDAIAQRDQVRSRIGYLAQTPAFYNYMTGEEFLLWTADIFSIERKTARLRSEELLRGLGIWDARRRRIGGYSGGMKQRLGFAQALINKPKLVFLDEPVSALDPVGRHEILNFIEQLKGQTTVFMCTHVLSDVERVCDRVIIARGGQVVVESSMTDLRQQHAAPVFTIEVDAQDRNITADLLALPYVSGVRKEGLLYTISARDVAAARIRLPEAILQTGATLVSYGAQAPNLEDIFLQVVGEA
ncbi:MAG TPA: ABC transporter ATP-binding protein [Symbiobacteriaceae bacterium]|nr:ABC transporter ATP-binding protein [Symbiobacteriaceae bacterium]